MRVAGAFVLRLRVQRFALVSSYPAIRPPRPPPVAYRLADLNVS